MPVLIKLCDDFHTAFLGIFLDSKYFSFLPFYHHGFFYHFLSSPGSRKKKIFDEKKIFQGKRYLRKNNICGKKIFAGKQCVKKEKDGETRRKCLRKRKIFETIIIFKTNRRKLILRNSVFLISLYCCC